MLVTVKEELCCLAVSAGKGGHQQQQQLVSINMQHSPLEAACRMHIVCHMQSPPCSIMADDGSNALYGDLSEQQLRDELQRRGLDTEVCLPCIISRTATPPQEITSLATASPSSSA